MYILMSSQKNHILFKEENMMKSFFKKLAFVMALAMVVTTAAPAANVFAAEFGIVEQNDEDAIRRLTSRGFRPYLPKPEEQPKRQTRKRTAKKEQ